MTADTRPIALTGGTVVTPHRTLTDGVVTVVGDRIESVGAPSKLPSMTDTVDVSGAYVLPGFVDIHGDDIERYLFPRPEEQVPVEQAVRQSERAAVSAGVTTKFHAIAFEEAPDDLRSIEMAGRLTDTILERRAHSPIDPRIHARCELGDDASVSAVRDRLDNDDVDLLSLMNHVPGAGQYGSTESLTNRYGQQQTAGDDRLTEVIQSRQRVTEPGSVGRGRVVTEAANRMGVPVASHDDGDADAVELAVRAGVELCEFPLSKAAARRAQELDVTVSMGAPNLTRGGSLWDNLDAGTAVAAGLVDVLCSDFRPETLLHSVFTDTGESLSTRVNRVSRNPARAVGLDDRGRLEPGQRADIVVVDPDPTPTVSRVFVAGREVCRFRWGG